MLEQLDEGVLRDVFGPFKVVEHQIHGSHHRRELHGEQKVVFRVSAAHPSSQKRIRMRAESILTPVRRFASEIMVSSTHRAWRQ